MCVRAAGEVTEVQKAHHPTSSAPLLPPIVLVAAQPALLPPFTPGRTMQGPPAAWKWHSGPRMLRHFVRRPELLRAQAGGSRDVGQLGMRRRHTEGRAGSRPMQELAF